MSPTFDDLTLAEDTVTRTFLAAEMFLAKAEAALRQTEAALTRLREVMERAEVAAARDGWDGLRKEAPDARRDG